MKSIIKKYIYTSLGVLSQGATAAQSLGKELAKKANVSEAEGERIAKKLQAESSKSVNLLRKTLDSEVTKIADTIHAAISAEPTKKKPKSVSKAKAKRRKSKA